MGEAVAAGAIQEALRRAKSLSYANLRDEKAKLAHERNPDKHSLEAVGILKKATDMEDKYLVYKINTSQFNREPHYIFKSSNTIAQFTRNGPEHPMQCEEANFEDPIHNL